MAKSHLGLPNRTDSVLSRAQEQYRPLLNFILGKENAACGLTRQIQIVWGVFYESRIAFGNSVSRVASA